MWCTLDLGLKGAHHRYQEKGYLVMNASELLHQEDEAVFGVAWRNLVYLALLGTLANYGNSGKFPKSRRRFSTPPILHRICPSSRQSIAKSRTIAVSVKSKSQHFFIWY